MNATVALVIRDILTLLLLTRMVIAGFFQPAGRIMSWPMFTRSAIVIPEQIEVASAEGEACYPINLYATLPRGTLMLSTKELQEVVDYLETSGEVANGCGVILYADGVAEFSIVDHHVAVASPR